MFKKTVLTVLTLALVGCGSSTNKTPSDVNYSQPRSVANFDQYVDYLRKQAVKQGVDANVAYSQQNIRFVERSIELDQQQAGRKRTAKPSRPSPNGVTNYLNRVLTMSKIALAVRYYNEQNQEIFAKSP